MRNLVVSGRSDHRLWGDTRVGGRLCAALSAECPHQLFTCQFPYLLRHDDDGVQHELLNVLDQVPDATEDQILDLFFLSVHRTLNLILKSGEIISVEVDTKSVTFPEDENVQDYCHLGIKAVGVSPEQEIIVILTEDDKILLVLSLFDLVTTADLLSESFGEGEFMTVGWGKKETQFHGSEGKQAAKKKLEFDAQVAIQASTRNITWRGDGAYFAVGYVVNSQSYFKVFNREGILQYTSEKQPGLECKFTWRPSGNLIATTQVFPHKYVVAFFEKNGLKHGELLLPFDYEHVAVESLLWSGDSEVLSVHFTNNQTGDSRILLYTISNYHWYLKQSLLIPNKSQLLAVKWEDVLSNNNGKCIHLVLDTGLHEKIEWVWCVDQSNAKNQSDDSVVGVIDGNQILITSFRHSVVPPPMSANVFQCNIAINRLLFGPILEESHAKPSSIDSNSFCAFMEDGSCCMFAKEDNNKFKLIGTTSLDFMKNAYALNNMLWLSKGCMLWVKSNATTSTLFTIDVTYEPELSMSVSTKTELNENIIGIRAIPGEKLAILQTSSGKLLHYGLLDKFEPLEDVSFPEFCHRFDICRIEDKLFAFGLTARNRLYINNVKIANNITSYSVHSDFLMLTTLQHQLLTFPLTIHDLNNLQYNLFANRKLDQNDSTSLMNRKLERGSVLVTVIPCESRTVLQLPRGNLEIIQPRVLSLKIIGNYLDRKDYRLAFDLMRKQRINLNLIYDHNPDEFLENVAVFINAIDNPSRLSLFTSELDEQDVTKTMYAGAYKNVERSAKVNMNMKIKTVCERMRHSLEQVNENNKFLLPILTTYVKSNAVEDLEIALTKIKSVKNNENDTNVVSANDALKYLLYMVNVDELYNIALGQYDFEMVMFVADKSQKDPKEYVPYINELKSMEENYRKYYIDNDLKRYDTALKHLIACGPERSAELLTFVKQHCLYSKAICQIPNDDDRYKRIAEEFGNFLVSKRHYTEAGMMYLRSSHAEKALECFIEALDWQSSITIAIELKQANEDILLLKRQLLSRLKEAGRYSEAISLIRECEDATVEEFIKCALEGKLFKTAMNICQRHQNPHFMDNLMKPAVIEQCNTLLATINQNQTQFEQQKDRLLVVRQNKAAKLIAAENCDGNLAMDCDLYSDTSSIAGSSSSRTSGRTFRSSKNRRKHERKLVSLKEGSRFEDIALVRALHALVCATFNLRHDVSEITYVLHWMCLDSEMKQLQETLDNNLNYIPKYFDSIWIPELNIEANKTLASELKIQDVTTITDASFSLEPHIRIPPVIQDVKWKLEYI
ncbi:elongator complex protein 1 [Arctopsyche grandis]|uniref:elongator complex protein 1 n=1 Tax=Arctopsyche grandis TaxID=121162 RepID=UPI00406D6D4C